MHDFTILLDVDGVLCDFVTAMLVKARQFGGPLVAHDQITEWGMFHRHGLEAVEHQCWAAAKGAGFIESLPLYPSAVECVKKLHKLGKVIVVTSPIYSNYFFTERAAMLHKHFEIKKEQIIFARDKSCIDGDFLIDDKADNIDSWLKSARGQWKTGLLIDRPWNQGYRHNYAHRLSLADAVSYIEALRNGD